MVHAVAHAVVLGCRVLANGAPSAALSRRIAAAAAWFAERPEDRALIASGGRRWDGQAEASCIAEALAHHGVPARAVIRELMSFNTAENAIYSAAILRARGASRVVVVTCDWHLPRALENFRASGFEAEGRAANSPAVSRWKRVEQRVHEVVSGVLDRRLRAGGGVRDALFLAQEDRS